MNTTYVTQSHQSILLGELLAQGGEGSVWSVVGRPEVAKIYHPTFARNTQEAKLATMVANPPRDEMHIRLNHVSITWPTAMLYQDSKFSGFLMPRLGESLKVLEVYNPRLRKARFPGFNWKYLVHTSLNLSIAMEAIHAKNYVIGDINESNIMVNRQALVSLIDTDSFQVIDYSGGIYRCPVGREEFTPPELQGIEFNQINRVPEHDYFGLAVMIFLLLMEGNHPFAGVLKTSNPGSDPDNIYCLKQGAFPYASNSLSIPRPTAPRFNLLPPDIQRLMLKCFVEGYHTPTARPTPGEWAEWLEKAESRLVNCRKDKNHWYSSHLRRCPWCSPVSTRLQAPLPAVQPVSNPKPAFPQKLNSRPIISNPSYHPNLVVSPQASLAAFNGATHSSGTTQDKLKRFVYRTRSFTHYSLNLWWRNTRLSLLAGATSGALLSVSIFLMFHYPDITSIVMAALAGLMILVGVFFLGRLVYNHFLRQNNPFSNAIGIILLFADIAVSISAGYLTHQLARDFLLSYQPQIIWLLIESCLLGLGGGAALGTYRYFSRPKKNWIALLWLAFITILTLLVVGLVGSQLMPFQAV
ncbi:MAG TPA: hypothetical protein VF326_15300 [Anaerolineaceae bacterium]